MKIFNRDFSKIPQKTAEKITTLAVIVLLLAFVFVCFKVYVPINPESSEKINFTVEKGWGPSEIGAKLEELKIIRSAGFFKFYAIVSLKNFQLQAGSYSLSPKDSIYRIVNKMAQGDVIRNSMVVFEGWDIQDIGKYMELRGICKQDYFVALTKKDYSLNYDFLKDKPKSLSLEGYLFPDTYELSKNATCEEAIDLMLKNFGKKLTPELRNEIAKQKKSIFEIVNMASIIEKEVRSMAEKEIISGIFWKRITAGMALQSCATINYFTGKNNAGALLADLEIDSPYNTYKYPGLPKGPISSPGLNSITAAIYPKATKYWYFLSNGGTVFSETLAQHNAAQAKLR